VSAISCLVQRKGNSEGKWRGVVTVIDRGGGKSLVRNGIKHSSIFTEKDFLKHVRKRLRDIGCIPEPSEI
jgi:orotate phosphoribosyltransferase